MKDITGVIEVMYFPGVKIRSGLRQLPPVLVLEPSLHSSTFCGANGLDQLIKGKSARHAQTDRLTDGRPSVGGDDFQQRQSSDVLMVLLS